MGLDSPTVTTSPREIYEALTQIDLSVEAAEVCATLGLSPQEHQALQEEFYRFMSVALTGRDLMPSLTIDALWHRALEREDFRTFCEAQNSGRAHAPCPADEELKEQSWDLVSSCFEGEAQRQYWESKASDCHNGH